MSKSDIDKMYIKNSSGDLVALSNLVTMTSSVQPNQLTRFQQLNSVTLVGAALPTFSTADTLSYLKTLAKDTLPSTISYDFEGDLRTYVEEGNTMLYAFGFSLLIIFLVLAAKFESFSDPLVVMLTVPMAICGALLPINWGLSSMNIYTQIGLITLIGLISKHGILMVDFAKNSREQNPSMTRSEAIMQAASIRLRPILMTTAAMALGVVPLLLSAGAGAVSRFDIGLTVFAGMSIGTLFTLFVIPTMYTLKTKQMLYFLLAIIVATPIVSFITGFM